MDVTHEKRPREDNDDDADEAIDFSVEGKPRKIGKKKRSISRVKALLAAKN